MKVFISWSGDAGKAMAEALADWLPTVIQALRPFYSTSDIQKGTRWFEEIGSQLESTHYGIICVTRSSLLSPWVHFEAGALSKRLDTSRVVPLLVDIKPTELKPPLSNFNAVTSLTKVEIRTLLRGLNLALNDDSLNEKVLDTSFERAWTEFEKTISEVLRLAAKEAEDRNSPEIRSAEDMLEEVLTLVREMGHAQATIWTESLERFSKEQRATLDAIRGNLLLRGSVTPNSASLSNALRDPTGATGMGSMGSGLLNSGATAQGGAAAALSPTGTTNFGKLLKERLKDQK